MKHLRNLDFIKKLFACLLLAVLLGGFIKSSLYAQSTVTYKLISPVSTFDSNNRSQLPNFRIDGNTVVLGNIQTGDSGFEVYDYTIDTDSRTQITELNNIIRFVNQAANGNFILQGYENDADTNLYLYRNGSLQILSEYVNVPYGEGGIGKNYDIWSVNSSYDGTLLWSETETENIYDSCCSNWFWTNTMRLKFLDQSGDIREILSSSGGIRCNSSCDDTDSWQDDDYCSLRDIESKVSEGNVYAWYTNYPHCGASDKEPKIYINGTEYDINEQSSTNIGYIFEGELYSLNRGAGSPDYKFNTVMELWDEFDDNQLENEIFWTYGIGDTFTGSYGKRRGNYEAWLQDGKLYKKDITANRTVDIPADFEYNSIQWTAFEEGGVDLSEEGTNFVYTVYGLQDNRTVYAIALTTIKEPLTLSAGVENPNSKVIETDGSMDTITISNHIQLTSEDDNIITVTGFTYDFIGDDPTGIIAALAEDSDCNGVSDTNGAIEAGVFDGNNTLAFSNLNETIPAGGEACYLLWFKVPSTYEDGCKPFGAGIRPEHIFARASERINVSGSGVNGTIIVKGEEGCNFIVNSTGNGGDTAPGDGECNTGTDVDDECTLRAAIEEANNLTGVDRITFNINTPGIPFISSPDAFPDITESVTIDGTTQADGQVMVRSENADAIVITAGNSTIRGLAVSGDGNGITLRNGGNNRITGNFIGAGAVDMNGIFIENSANNIIGGPTDEERNIITGCSDNGIEITGESSDNNVIEGNYLGIGSNGATNTGNNLNGIALNGGSENIIKNNIISNNRQNGIFLQTGSTGTIVKGNIIGTSANYNTATLLPDYGNGENGILIHTTNTTVGGENDEDRNIIAHNNLSGIEVNLTNNNSIKNNVISSNAVYGIKIHASASNTIQKNIIGTSADYSFVSSIPDLGNSDGISIENDSNNNIVGGEDNGNVIAQNQDKGVIIDDGSEGNLISSNSIFMNHSNLNIDLGNDGITPNDIGDDDTGANTLRNWPELESAVVMNELIIVRGFMIDDETVTAEFFVTPQPQREGWLKIWSGPLETTAEGNQRLFEAVFPLPQWLPMDIGLTYYITATVTDGRNNTSEFSNYVELTDNQN